MKILKPFVVAGIASLLTACASGPPLAVGPVGPALAPESSTGKGYLRVFTETKKHNDGEVMYFPHTGYKVYSTDEKLIQAVSNAISTQDEQPALVKLPAGTYLVKAQSEDYALVTVTVVIKPGRLTEVNLEHDWNVRLGQVTNPDLVLLPNGQIVGTRAQ